MCAYVDIDGSNHYQIHTNRIDSFYQSPKKKRNSQKMCIGFFFKKKLWIFFKFVNVASSAATAVAVAAAAAASSSVLKYLNVQNVHDHIAHANVLNASALLPFNNSFNDKKLTTPAAAAAATTTTTAASALQLSSPSTNAYTNFMYANWIDLHAKIPDQTKYLFCLQGNLSFFPFDLKFLPMLLHIKSIEQP